MFRRGVSPDHRAHPDQAALELSDVRYEIAARDEHGVPTSLRARFSTPLEDEQRVFVVWSPEASAYVRYQPKAVGETDAVAGQKVVELLTGP